MLVKTVGSNRFRRGIESDRDLRAGFFLFCWPSSRLLEIVVDQFRWTHERCGRASLPSCARYHCVAINHSCEAVTPPMGGVSVPPHRSPRVLDKSKNSARISQRRIPRKKKKKREIRACDAIVPRTVEKYSDEIVFMFFVVCLLPSRSRNGKKCEKRCASSTNQGVLGTVGDFSQKLR